MTSSPNLPGGIAPYSQEAEEAVIGAVLINPEVFLNLATFLKADDFFITRHSYIWEALLLLSEHGERIDFITVRETLRASNRLNEIGGPAYLLQLVNSTPSSEYAEVYGRLVERAATRRRLLAAADEIKLLALNEELTIERVTSEAEARLFNVTERSQNRDLVPMREAVNEYFDRIEHLLQHPDEPLGLPTGFRDLDELLGGLQRSDLLIFAGRPGMGKTSFLLSVALNAAKLGGRILIFTMEMGHEQLTQRFLSMETGINTQKLRTGQLSEQEWSRFVQATGRLGQLPIFIDDTPAMTPIQMRTKCRRVAHEFGLDLVIVDYLQLMGGGGTYENNRVQEISYISRSLKELARELNVPLFSAAQLSRAVESRQDKRPMLSDLRESGCLAGESPVYLPDTGEYVPIRDLIGREGTRVLALDQTTYKLEPAPISHAFCTGVKPVYKLTTQLGRSIRATGNHKFLTIEGWKRLDELTAADHIALPGHEQQNISLERALRLANIVKSRPMPALAQSDIYWDAVASIEPDGETEVYDLTVPHHACFVSCNILTHNSIEQDADIVIFLYRDVVYNEATEFPNRADLLISKHRNGETGVVSLHFERSLTKFTDAKVARVNFNEA